MPDEVSKTTVETKTSDGTVNISVEKYNELLDKAAEKAPVVNQIVHRVVKDVHKTPEMLAKESRLWGGSLMTVGAAIFATGAGLFKSGRLK